MKQLSLSNRMVFLLLGMGIAVSAAWKLILISYDSFPFNADEAIVALMARHILNGEVPIFFYGQAYMGSLDAFLVALSFLLVGEKINAIRYVQIFLYCGVLLTTFWLSILIFKSRLAALFSVFLLVIPTVNLALYTTVSLGGYGEALLIGNLILCIGFLITNKRSKPFTFVTRAVLFFLWGLLFGLGLWANGLTLVYSLPMGLFLLFWIIREKEDRRIALFLLAIILGGLIGASPWISYAVNNSFNQLFQELLGSAVAVEGGSWFKQIALHTLNFVLFGIPVILGFRPPWEVRWLVLPLIPFVGGFWFLVIKDALVSIRESRGGKRWQLLLPGSVIIFIVILFIFTNFGVDPSGRYFLPINVILALFAGFYIDQGISKTILKFVALVLIIGFQVLGTVQCLQRIPPGITTQFDTSTIFNRDHDAELIEFLRSTNETRGYTNYWVSYPLAFISGEELIFTPRLPYHQDLRYTTRDDRYAPYSRIIERSEKIALITTRNDKLEELIRSFLQKRGITWDERQIGDYLVFYDLSAKFDIEDLQILFQP